MGPKAFAIFSKSVIFTEPFTKKNPPETISGGCNRELGNIFARIA